MIHNRLMTTLAAIGILLSGCGNPSIPQSSPENITPPSTPGGEAPDSLTATPLPVRPNYTPGEIVDYIAQSGDTLPALAARFNTTIPEIMAANPIIPSDATTMPPGLPIKIPIYFKALWASPFKIIPDAAFVNGPAQIGFNTSAFVASRPGWLKNYIAYAGGEYRTGAEVVDYVATNYSVSPRLLLAVLEYSAGALTQPSMPDKKYILDFEQPYFAEAPNLAYLQLVWAADTLNNGYYGWRVGGLTEFDEPDGTLIRPDPWQNAASVGIQYLFSRANSGSNYDKAVNPDGLAKTYRTLFGDPWVLETKLIPGSLQQPPLLFPFPAGQVWTYTGGPHTGWGSVGSQPFSAVDFGPPSEHHGCFTPDPQNYATAVADGLIVRSGPEGIVLDLDGDGDERTGWVIYYLHLSNTTRVPLGKEMHSGDLIGYPSCQGGELVTGTHVHIARKYNGEWILADGPLGFNFEGWRIYNGKAAYQGTMKRNGLTVTACTCSDFYSQIRSDFTP
jgi:LysM repeat protein